MSAAHSIRVVTEMTHHRFEKNFESGFALLESLVSLLLFTIIGFGLVYALSRAASAQKTMNAQILIVNKIRATVQQNTSGIASTCPASGTSTANLTITDLSEANIIKNCTMTDITVNAASKTFGIRVPVIEYNVTSASLLGNGNTFKLSN